MLTTTFVNDNNVVLITPNKPEHPYSALPFRPYHEVGFRQLTAYLMNTKLVQGNIIDLGAWIGDNSVPWGKMNPQNVIYAIDPSDVNCNFIKEMIELNHANNVKVIQSAISDKMEIISTDHNLLHATFNQDQAGQNKVQAVTLDYLDDEKIIENIGYIHLDVEGMEFQVLNGSNKIIEKYRPIIAYEVHLTTDKHVEDIKQFLKSKNYVIYLIDEVLPGCNYDCRNCLAIPQEKHPSDLPEKLNKHFFNSKYYILSHTFGRISFTSYSSQYDAMVAYELLKGGPYATILVDTSLSENKVIRRYGNSKCTKQCEEYLVGLCNPGRNILVLQ